MLVRDRMRRRELLDRMLRKSLLRLRSEILMIRVFVSRRSLMRKGHSRRRRREGLLVSTFLRSLILLESIMSFLGRFERLLLLLVEVRFLMSRRDVLGVRRVEHRSRSEIELRSGFGDDIGRRLVLRGSRFERRRVVTSSLCRESNQFRKSKEKKGKRCAYVVELRKSLGRRQRMRANESGNRSSRCGSRRRFLRRLVDPLLRELRRLFLRVRHVDVRRGGRGLIRGGGRRVVAHRDGVRFRIDEVPASGDGGGVDRVENDVARILRLSGRLRVLLLGEVAKVVRAL